MFFPKRGTKAFTLLELIVVIVILGILAAIAVPSFQKVIVRSQDSATETTLSALLREAQALAAFENRGVTAADIEAASEDLTIQAAEAGTYAEAKKVVAWLDGEANAPALATRTDLLYKVDGNVAGVSLASASGNCVFGRVDGVSSGAETWVGTATSCTGTSAVAGPGSETVAAPAPEPEPAPEPAPVLPASGIALHLDASNTASITSSGGAVTQWADLSGLGNHAGALGSITLPVYDAAGFNGKPTVQFTGDVLTTAAAVADTSDVTLFVVGTSSVARGSDVYAGSGWSMMLPTVTDSTLTPRVVLHGAGPAQYNSTPAADSALSPLGTLRVDQESASSKTSIDSWRHQLPAQTSTVANYTLRDSSVGFLIGGRSGVTTVDGSISEVVVYNRALSDAEVADAQAALATKWGIAASETAAPSAPQNLTATAGDARATLVWDAPVTGPTSHYVVTQSPGGVSTKVSARMRNHTFTGLTNGTAYTFTVAAVNAAGSSTAVSASGTPTALLTTGLVAHMDASNLSSVLSAGGEVRSWSDLSGVGNHGTAGTSNRPAHVNNGLAGRPAVVFTSDYVDLPQVVSDTSDTTVFLVGTSGLGRGVDGSGAGWSLSLVNGLSNIGASVLVTNGAASYAVARPAGAGSAPLNVFRVDQRTSDTVLSGWASGTKAADNVPGNLTFRSSGVGFTFGRSSGASAFRDGSVSEVLVYNRALTDAEVASVQSHLAAKWGLTIP